MRSHNLRVGVTFSKGFFARGSRRCWRWSCIFTSVRFTLWNATSKIKTIVICQNWVFSFLDFLSPFDMISWEKLKRKTREEKAYSNDNTMINNVNTYPTIPMSPSFKSKTRIQNTSGNRPVDIYSSTCLKCWYQSKCQWFFQTKLESLQRRLCGMIFFMHISNTMRRY